MACIFFCKRIEYSTQYLVLKTTHFWSDFFSFFWEISGTFWFSDGMSKFLFDQKNHNNGDLFPRFVKKDTLLVKFKHDFASSLEYLSQWITKMKWIYHIDFSPCIFHLKKKLSIFICRTLTQEDLSQSI